MRKGWLILNTMVLGLVILLLVWIVWNFSFTEKVVEPEECIEVNKVSSFVYDACYDAYSKSIFLEAKRSSDSYKVNALELSFFDFLQKGYELTDVPSTKGSKAYKIPAEKNPQNIDISLDIVKDFSAPICEEPRRIFVDYCPVIGDQDGAVNVSMSPLDGVEIEDFITIKRPVRQDSDMLNLNLVEKERVWKSQCESDWECSEWESCDDGVQKRSCNDVKECFIPTDVPDTARYCDGTCAENWECEWSNCEGGFTIPECMDLSGCGTSYDIPQKLECDIDRQCLPDIECSEWSSCEVDYNFMDLVGGSISELTGSKSRICEDKNDCSDSREDVRSCSVGVDIYTKRFSKCGEDFVGIYDRLDNSLIARISEGDESNPYLNINLDGSGDSPYCDYCFDGRKNGDEEGIDCGGSCELCDTKYKKVDFKKKTTWNKFSDWIKKMLT